MRLRFGSLFLLPGLLTGGLSLAAQNVQVNSAVPNSAAQGTINLNVTVGGNGFKRGAGSKFLVTGTTDTGGVTVNSTAFVSSTQLTANINVSDTATISNFDVVVTNTDGRSGKGTGLFSVQAKGTPTCTLSPLPSQFTLITTLNNAAPAYTGGLGASVRVKHLTLGGRDVLVTGVGSTSSGKLEVFFLDPVTAAVLDGTVIGTQAQPQPHITKSITLASGAFGARVLTMGDVNGDGVPDIVVGDKDFGAAFAFVGSVDVNGNLGYSEQISFPSGPGRSLSFGYGIALGDLDGVAGDEVAVADAGFNGTKGNKQPGGVFIYHFSAGSFTLAQTISQPAFRIAIGDVTGDSNLDLIVGATSGNTYVYPGLSLSNPITFSGVGPRVGAANVDGGPYTDLIIGNGSSSSTPGQDSVYSGLVSAGQQPAFTVTPVTGLDTGWNTDLDAGDINGDGLADLLIGAPNTQPSNACPSNVGTAYVFLTNPATPDQPTRYALEPPAPDVDFGAYGWSMGAAAGTRIFLVGETGRNINGVSGAGQVYVYKVN